MAKKKAKGKGKGSSKKKKGASSSSDVKLPKLLPPTVNEKLWKARFAISEKARKEHRENASMLIQTNASLEQKIEETEQDTMEVVAYLRRDLAQCEDKLKASKDYVAEMKRKAQQEVDAAIDACDEKVAQLSQQLNDRTLELDTAKKELASLRDFKYQRDAMEKDIFELQEQNKRAQQAFEREKQVMETKFFEEKARIQKATELQLESLAKEAHRTAVESLDVTTRDTFEENERLHGELKLHISEVNELRQTNADLKAANQSLAYDLHEKTEALSEQVALGTRLRAQNTALSVKLATLEQKLSESLQQHMSDVGQLREEAEDDMAELKYSLELTQQSLNLKAAELQRIKRLARNVLHQRTLVEQFFLDSLQHVRRQVAESRAMYAKAAKTQYNEAMRDGYKTGAMPAVKTFGATSASANDLNAQFSAADNTHVDLDSVKVEDLTWEQREQVLRQLFAKMNGVKLRKTQSKASAKGSTAASARMLPTPPDQAVVKQKLLALRQ